ncbi:MarR family transcriptional regulator [Amycolatopsis anabasis]|uniref:MarR family transcriptional regulator n=1 Tax=Amycolatopsis anabasis TaxID=1840409 RepID=UPI0015D29EE3
MTAAEEFALTLTKYGLQRMTARVLGALLFTEQETITAGEIAEQLAVSPGSVSTAIKSLDAVGLIERVPAPGSRREHYRFPDDGWARLMSTQNAVVRMMQEAAQRGIDATGADSLAGRRLAEMWDFYDHVLRELPAVIERWRVDRKDGA